ncbi:MAG: 2-oxoacid:acceptor oxidoreductase family protein [Pseudomonadota bacterium]
MIGIRVHGRGGQGAVTFAHILSIAATFEGKYGQSSQALTVERRGAPAQGFARIGDRPITERGLMSRPDYVVVIDPLVIRSVDVEAGLAENGLVVANSARKLHLKHPCVHLDATSIALEILKRPITNTVMLGAFVGATGMVSMDSIDKGVRFMLGKKIPEDEIELNLIAIHRAYDTVKNA